MTQTLLEQIKTAPKPVDRKIAQSHLTQFFSSRDTQDLTRLIAHVDYYPKFRDLLLALAGHSPYLWRLVHRDPSRLLQIIESDPEAHFSGLVSSCAQAATIHAGDEAAMKRRLRLIKQKAALLIALCDLGGKSEEHTSELQSH